MFEKTSSGELDILRETANIGAGNAAAALSKLIGKKVHMRVPSAEIVPFHELADAVGGAETKVLAIYFQLKGDFTGSMYVLMKEQAARQLLDDLFGMVPQESGFSDMHRSALAEMGNIVAGTYLSALSDFTSLVLRLSVPHLAFDMAGAVLDVGVVQVGMFADEALMVNASITASGVSADTHVILLPQPDDLPALFRALGVDRHGH